MPGAAALDWTFDGTWPFEPRWLETTDGRMHFIDEGPRTGRPVVLVHGNPSWGYLYRRFVAPLSAAGYRVIVPDHLGFGRSDKPDRALAYGIDRHAERFGALLDSLELRDVTLVPHDWGGAIAMSWAAQRPQRVRGLFVLNGFAHRPRGRVSMPAPLRLCRARWLGELFVKGMHAVLRGFLFGAGITKRDRLSALVRAAYVAPHPRWSDRTAILAFARSFPAAPEGPVSELLEGIRERWISAGLASRPVAIAWAGRDGVFGEAALGRWVEDFPHADVLRIPDAGHFLQEDAHELVVPALLGFLGKCSDA
jgi:pimeloyl-ACP methyl ester carboxylesterase